MHSLHCVNAIRKALSYEYYMTHDEHLLPEAMHQVHVGEWEHCMVIWEKLLANVAQNIVWTRSDKISNALAT